MLAKAVVFHEFGGPEVLRLETVEVPDPGPGEVRIRVEAIGFNRAEAHFRHGWYPTVSPELPSRIGFEAVGRIESLGAGVDGFASGTRVGLQPLMALNKRGCYGEVINVPANAVLEAAPELDAVENAALWNSYITVYAALVDVVSIKPGDFVLVTAASSGCGAPAIQMVNMLGAKPIAVTRSRTKAAAIQALGPHATIATEDEDLGSRVAEITGGQGVQVVFDSVGGPHLDQLIEITARYGTIIYFGMSDGTDPIPLPLGKLFLKNLTIRAFALYLWEKPERTERAIAFIREGVARGALKPVISKVFEFPDILEAAKYFDSLQQTGKVVVSVSGGSR